jgi:hypothetical protein
LTEICWKRLRVRVRYFVQIIIPRFTSGPHVESRTLKLKTRVYILKFQRIWLKFVGDVFEWQTRYFVQIIIPRYTRGPHVESRTLKLKARVHTLKFQRIYLKFVGNILEWQYAILCKLVELDPHIRYIWKMDFMWHKTGLRNIWKIRWRYHKMAVHYFVQIIIPRSTCGLHIDSRTLKLKAPVHTLNFNEFDWNLLKMS